MQKLLFLFLLLPYLSISQSFNAELIQYTNKLFTQAATGEITVLDPLMRQLPPDSLYNQFITAKPYMANNINDNYYTRNTFKQAAFINSFHYGLFEGTMGLPDLPTFLFDTLTYKPNPSYILFSLYRYNDDGSFKDKKKLFILSRKVTLVNTTAIQNRAIQSAADSANRQRVKILCTKNNEYWKISGISINKKPTTLDICQLRYCLELDSNMHFQQYYVDTADFTINRKTAVSSGIERGFYFIKDKEHVQCYLENESGIWTIKGNRLMLTTFTGIVLNNYTIINLTKGKMVLQLKNYTITLSKNHL